MTTVTGATDNLVIESRFGFAVHGVRSWRDSVVKEVTSCSLSLVVKLRFEAQMWRTRLSSWPSSRECRRTKHDSLSIPAIGILKPLETQVINPSMNKALY